MIPPLRRGLFSVLFCVSAALVLACASPDAATGPAERPVQTIRVVLDPAHSRLTGESRISNLAGDSGEIRLFLNENARVDSATWNDEPVDFEFADGAIRVSPGSGGKGTLAVRYAGVFDDPAPVRPVNMDNPGHGAAGTISEAGTLLLGGSGWYPVLPGASPKFEVEIDAPEGVLAVTAGDLVAHRTAASRTVSVWKTDAPVEVLALSAGRYELREKKAGPVRVMTYFLPETRDLSDAYLVASAEYIERYSSLFGPYPFAKFAVVENFFPAGYGFPSYTLMGGRVLRLPFILTTSLGHEIAHCWWGNGVYVDVSGGNWSEGLTTYVSDYLFEEEKSAEAAREYRLKMVRSYAALVPPDGGFPLSEFRSRVDRPSQAIGYHKAAMVFHMLRRRAGDERFWEILRNFYAAHRFKPASWADFQAAFEKGTGEPLADFFRSWIAKHGAPMIFLADAAAEKSGDGWIVRGRLESDEPGWDLRVPVTVETVGGSVRETVALTTDAAVFGIPTDARPVRLAVDPGADTMRRLHPEEVPPTVNRLKGAERVLVVIAADAPPELRETAELLVRSLGLRRYRIVDEADADPGRVRESGVLVLGNPRRTDLIPDYPEILAMKDGGFVFRETDFRTGSDAFFGVFDHPAGSGNVLAVFRAEGKGAATAARKITHYGTYSYLVFHEGENRVKGTWPVTESPLVRSF